MKADISLTSTKFPATGRSYSPEEVLTAGGATAFGRKYGSPHWLRF